MIGGSRQLTEYASMQTDLATLQDLVAIIHPERQTILDAARNAEPIDAALLGNIEEAIQLAELISDNLEVIGEELQDWISLVELIAQVLDELYLLYFSPALVQTGATLADLQASPTRTYTVKQGDVLEGIAFAELGSAERWQEIIDANDLDLHAELTSTWAGTVLQLPIQTTTAAGAQVSEVWTLTTGLAAFGRDFPNALELTPAGDLSLLDPVYTLLQGLSNVLLTERGSIATNPRFGTLFGDMLGEDFGDLTTQMVGVEIKRAINTDSRIRSVGSIQVKKEADSLTASFNVTTVLGDTQAIQIGLPTIPYGGYEVRPEGRVA